MEARHCNMYNQYIQYRVEKIYLVKIRRSDRYHDYGPKYRVIMIIEPKIFPHMIKLKSDCLLAAQLIAKQSLYIISTLANNQATLTNKVIN